MHHLAITSIEPHEVPLSFDTDKSYPMLASLIELNDRILAVDQKLKGLVQQIEPNIHEFFPININMPGGKTSSLRYYIMVIRQYLSSYQPDLSDPKRKNFSGLVFSKEALFNAHLWKDRGTPALIYFSDEMKREIDSAGLSVPKLYKMKLI